MLAPTLLLLLSACSGGARAPGEPGEPMSEPASKDVTFTDAEWRPLLEGEAGAIRLHLLVNVPDHLLMDNYPEVRLATSDARFEIDNANATLYGLGPGTTPLGWTLSVTEPVPKGTTVPFDILCIAESMGPPDQSPVGKGQFKLTLEGTLNP